MLCRITQEDLSLIGKMGFYFQLVVTNNHNESHQKQGQLTQWLQVHYPSIQRICYVDCFQNYNQ